MDTPFETIKAYQKEGEFTQYRDLRGNELFILQPTTVNEPPIARLYGSAQINCPVSARELNALLVKLAIPKDLKWEPVAQGSNQMKTEFQALPNVIADAVKSCTR